MTHPATRARAIANAALASSTPERAQSASGKRKPSVRRVGWPLVLVVALVACAPDALVEPSFARKQALVASTSIVPSGNVSALIDAITLANLNPDADVIDLASGGTYTLTGPHNADNGLPIITTAITINGNGAIIERSSDAGTAEFRIVFVESTGDLTLNATTIRGGALFAGGVGINNLGYLRLNDCLVTGNRGDGGAGIYNNGVAELTNSTVSNNVDRFLGAGIYNNGSANLTLTNSSITGNTGRLRGTGIYNSAGITINSTVSGNVHEPASATPGQVMLINSTLSGTAGPNHFGGI